MNDTSAPSSSTYRFESCGTVIAGDRVEIGVLRVAEGPSPRETLEGEATHLLEIGKKRLGFDDHLGALTAFDSALERTLGDPEIHFYRALCLLAGRRPRDLTAPVIRQVEAALRLAAGDEPPGHVLLLQAFLKADFYRANGLLTPPPPPETLLEAARDRQVILPRLQELYRHTPIEGFVQRPAGGPVEDPPVP